jgi:antitoxin MazE
LLAERPSFGQTSQTGVGTSARRGTHECVRHNGFNGLPAFYFQLVWIYNRLGISFMQVSKWGNSLAVRLPALVVEALDLKEGDEIEISIAGKRDFKVARDRSKKRALEQLRQMKWSFPPDFKFNREEINER